MSSLVTDGASANTGEKGGGLWTIINRMRGGAQTDYSDECLCPLMKIWCMAHRLNLAWKSVGDTVPELNVVFRQLTGLSSLFHKSGLRTRELKSIAAENNLKLLNLPKTFEVRRTEFTTKLVTAVLTSWHALVFYFQKCDDMTSKLPNKFRQPEAVDSIS